MTSGFRSLRRGPSDSQDAATGGEPLDDAALIAAVRAGHPAVANAFCRRIWPVVDHTVRRLLGAHHTDREDVTQLALLETVRSIGGYRGDSSLDTWVSSVAANIVYKHIRRRPLAQHLNLELFDDTLATAHPNGEQSSINRQIVARVVTHLEALGEKLAWCFILHEILGYGLKDAARIMGISVAAAQSRLVRGRKQIHDSIAQDPELANLLEGTPLPRRP